MSVAELSPPLGSTPSAASLALQVEGLNHFYGHGDTRKQVLFDNHLDISAGEIVIMTGPSGSGKTTLLTLIGALRTVQQGGLRVLDHDLSALPPDSSQRQRRQRDQELLQVRGRIGFIFQHHNLFDSLTASQNVQLALELKERNAALRRRLAEEWLGAVGLAKHLHKKPEALSGGQRQRVAIARALANRPKLILADEPTAALDEESGRSVVQLLQRLAQEEGCTSLIVTHDNRILDVADRLVSMVDGHIKSNVMVKERTAIAEFLAKCDVFLGLSSLTLATMAEKMRQERFATGTPIIRQGEVGDTFYVLRQGSVEVIRENGEGPRRVRVLQAGDHFGEMALASGNPRSATVVPLEPVEVYTLGKADFEAAIAANPSFAEQIRKAYFQRQ